MHWIKESGTNWFQSFVINIIKKGKTPKHIAFIMDGNRRYARKNHLVRAVGHLHGFDTLSKILSWCKDLGVNEITVYAFSIENFKRSQDEVDDLMTIAREKFDLLIKELGNINEHGIRIKFWGEIDLLPSDIQEKMAKIMLATRDNNKGLLNVCFAYTSRYEISNAMNKIKLGIEEKIIEPRDITESLIEQCLHSAGGSPPDLLIRTSGEVRLSDFLLWQSGFTIIAFIEVLWPEFSFWNLISCLLYYQRYESQVCLAHLNYIRRRDLYEQNLIEKSCLFEDKDEDEESLQEKALSHHSKRFLTFLKRLESLEHNELEEKLNSLGVQRFLHESELR